MSFGYAVYFTERPKNRVIRWDPDSGDVDVVAGEPKDDDPSQKLKTPYGIAFDRDGNLLIADKHNYRIARLKNGRLETVDLRDTDGHRRRLSDSPPTYVPQILMPTGLSAENAGTVLCTFINDHTVYRIHPDGRLELIVGVVPNRPYTITCAQETFLASDLKDATLFMPAGVAARSDGTIFFVERGHQIIRECHPKRGLRSVFPFSKRLEFSHKDRAPSEAALKDYHPSCPGCVAVDPGGTLFVGEIHHRCVIRVDLAAGRLNRVLETRVAAGRPLGGIDALAFGPDGTAWVMDADQGVIEAYHTTAAADSWKPRGTRLSRVRGEDLVLPGGGAGITTRRT